MSIRFKTITRAVIPAAGLGTRFLPATKATPKEMLPIVDKPTIQYIVEEALASGRISGFIIFAKKSREDWGMRFYVPSSLSATNRLLFC